MTDPCAPPPETGRPDLVLADCQQRPVSIGGRPGLFKVDAAVQIGGLVGHAGRDFLYGEDGNDSIVGGGGNDEIHGGAGNDTMSGGGGRDVIYGGDGDDMLEGDGYRDLLYGGAGNDTLIGDVGMDTLEGGEGNDILDGGAANDFLTGGAGDDTMTGGDGGDQFIFNDGFGQDTITDFGPFTANELINFSQLDDITSFTDLIDNHTVQDGADVVITSGTDSLMLSNTLIYDLSADDFIF